jgi:hypothetical protein
MRLNLLRTSR